MDIQNIRRAGIQVLVLLFVIMGFKPAPQNPVNPVGAWQLNGKGGEQTVLIFSDQIFSAATFNQGEKKFIASWGGAYTLQQNKVLVSCEWNSLDSTQVGTTIALELSSSNGKLSIDKLPGEWTQMDDGTPGKLAGAWIITGSYNNDVVAKRRSPFHPRRTMKLLSGKHFQWIAYNVVTKQFIDTGGGTYTTTDGKYTETISYFTKTAASVGKTLGFDYSFVDGDWRHKGQKSTGGVMDECWTRRAKLETKD